MKQYGRFSLMILTSTIVMFFLMHFNIFQLDHFMFSQMRVYMAILMGAVMAIIMLLFMWKMYENKKLNYLILGIAVVVFGVSLWGIRTQAGIGDLAWMRAMIPHHSTAILTSERADITDTRVQELRDEIIQAQEEEIAEMKALIKDIEENSKQE